MASVSTQPDFDLRFYDGTPTTPFYIPATFLDPPTLPLAEPRPETTVILGGGRAAVGNIASIIPDEAPIFQPIPFSIRFALQSEAVGLIDAIGNPRKLSPWNIGTAVNLWVPVPVNAIGNRTNSAGVAIPAPGPKDQLQIDGLFNLVAINNQPGDAPNGVNFAVELKGCVTISVSMVVEAPQVFVAFECACFGAIDSQITNFPAGNETILP